MLHGALTFYSEISEADRNQNRKATYNQKTFTFGKPSLSSKPGDSEYSDLKAGWLWDKALKATGGNPNAAIELIGMCGHDDVGGRYPFPISAEAAKDLLEKNITDLKKEIEEQRQALSKAAPGAEYRFVNDNLKRLENMLEAWEKKRIDPKYRLPNHVVCPAGESAMFVPKSLGDGVDLPDELKSAIAEVQRPQGGTKELLAKHYHFYGAAYMGCQMAKCGISPDLAARAQRTFGSAYRSIRLCESVRSTLGALNEWRDELDMDPNDPRFPKSVLELGMKKARELANDPKKAGKACTSISSVNKTVCNVVIMKPGYWETAFSNLVRDMDAAVLYRNWYLGGGSAFKTNLPCTDIRLSGPEKINEPDYFQNRPAGASNPPGSMCNMPGWSSDRCSNARKKLATWDADFNWTKTQHEIGARFGATQCRKQDPNESLDSRMCSVLKAQPSKEQGQGQQAPVQPSGGIK